MKRLMYLLCFLLLSVLVACDRITTDETEINTAIPNEDKTDNPYIINDMADDMYKGKEAVVWVMPFFFQDLLTEDRCIAFNDALYKNGEDFYLRFLFVNYDQGGGTPAYLNEIESHIKYGTQIDLLFTGSTWGGISTSESFAGYLPEPRIDDTLMLLYEMKLISPLDEYLSSEEGQKLFEVFPVQMWKTTSINHQIYGIPFLHGNGYSDVIRFYGLNPSNYAISKTALTGDPLSWRPLLDEINDPDVLRFSIRTSDYAPLLGLDCIAEAVMFDPERGAFNFFEDSECLNLLWNIRTLVEDGYAPEMWDDYYYDYFENSEMKRILYSRVDYIDIYSGLVENEYTIPISEIKLDNSRQSVAIAASSQQKEHCVRLLSQLFTDRELADLLVYGSEGIDYTKENGIVSAPDDCIGVRAWLGLFGFTSPMLQDYVEYTYLDNWQTAIYDITEEHSSIGFRFRREGWDNTIANLLRIVQSYETHTVDSYGNLETQKYLLCGQFDNMNEELDRLRHDLRNAGIDELIEEINRQYDEWKAAAS